MRIMTFNLRFENDRDGANGWEYRKEMVADVIRECSPSILGTQEGTGRQLAFLESRLRDYRICAAQRPEDETCQYPTLFYREDEFRLIERGEFWLSTRPAVHRSKDWDSAFPRMMSYGLFEDISNAGRLWVGVTHLDNIGLEARMEQAKILSVWLRSRLEPKILMGDFNDRPGSHVHQLLTSAEVGLGDSWEMLSKLEDEKSMTHHGFDGIPKLCRMDWILISHGFQLFDAKIIRYHRRGRYPSDHFPYSVDLEWL